jgi:hypothetical protein
MIQFDDEQKDDKLLHLVMSAVNAGDLDTARLLLRGAKTKDYVRVHRAVLAKTALFL